MIFFVCNRKIYRSPVQVCQFQVSVVGVSIKGLKRFSSNSIHKLLFKCLFECTGCLQRKKLTKLLISLQASKKISSNVFLEIRNTDSPLNIFSNTLVVYCRKKIKIFFRQMNFMSREWVSQKYCSNGFVQTRYVLS